MISGERGYLVTDADLQLACRQALRLPSPTVALVRPWSATTVTLGEAAVHLGIDRVLTPAQQFDESALGLAYSAHPLRLATPTLPSGSGTQSAGRERETAVRIQRSRAQTGTQYNVLGAAFASFISKRTNK